MRIAKPDRDASANSSSAAQRAALCRTDPDLGIRSHAGQLGRGTGGHNGYLSGTSIFQRKVYSSAFMNANWLLSAAPAWPPSVFS